MASKYWIKLYHEMLDDPKVGRLNDSIYRRFIECLLLAGELDASGLLPLIEDMAWRLHIAETALSQDMSRLAMGGLVELKQHEGQERWFVTKFAERQAPSSAAERMRELRKRKRKEAKEKEEIGINKDTDTDTYRTVTPVTNRNERVSPSDIAAVSLAYENNIGSLTPIISNALADSVEEVGIEWVLDAIGEAVKNNVRKWSYINAILNRWRDSGKQTMKQTQTVTQTSDGGMYV